tara:strand:- start:711 stop:1352 length:642 start_codon:yes stop_codon:yes gene_type:complete
MLINPDEVLRLLKSKNITITGVFHIGACDCEELGFYNNKLGLENKDVIWIDAIKEKVENAKKRGITTIYNEVITDKDGDEIEFNVTNNLASSSILELGTHAKEHPHIHYTHKIKMKSITIDSFLKKYDINNNLLNFWNLDIQGAELLALQGGCESMQSVDIMYLEVNKNELYKNCGLISDIDNFLSKHNFKRVKTNITKYGWGDAIYLNTKYL